MEPFRAWTRKPMRQLTDGSGLWPAGPRSLSIQQAEQIVAETGRILRLPGLRTLTPAVARVLARHKDDLVLPGLRSIAADVAHCLAQQKGRLYLNGCRSLDIPAAKKLVAHGLDTIRESAATCLRAREAWYLSLGQNDETAETDDPRILAASMPESIFIREQTLSLSGLKKIPATLAEVLGEHRGELILDGVRELSDAAAAGLGKHFGSLDLNGLRSLTPNAATNLAHGGGEWPRNLPLTVRLSLNGLKHLSPDAARGLARWQGPLWLNGLRRLPPAVAAALATFTPQDELDKLHLGVRRLSPAAAREFAPFRGTLSLDGLRTVSTDLAKALVEVKGRIWLRRVSWLRQEAAEILFSRGGIHLWPC
jgi:hypothetical protein